MPDTVTLVLLVIAVILSAAVLVLLLVRTRRQPGADDEKIIRHTDDALGGLRRDLYQQNETLRTAVTDALHKSEEKTDKLSERTYEGQLRVSRALNEMQEKVSQTGKAQTEAVTAAVEKLQFSNEKKLDEITSAADKFYSISASVGFVMKPINEGAELGKLLKDADEIMYIKKSARKRLY